MHKLQAIVCMAATLFAVTLHAQGVRRLEAQTAPTSQLAAPSLENLQQQLQQQAAELRDLRKRIDSGEYAAPSAGGTQAALPDCTSNPEIKRLPVVADAGPPTCGSNAPQQHLISFYASYDRGFVIRPFNQKQNPFELKTTGWIQFRHHAFARDVSTWTDSAGVTRPVRNRNAFDIERARLAFAGTALDSRSTWFLQLDGDTDGSHAVDFFDYWWAWRFSDSFQLQVGKRKVPGSRQWLLGARRTRFIDRPVANDFFRPDRTVGLFGVGKIGDTGHYEIMAGNGHSTSNLPNSRTDNKFTFAASNYFDPLGAFGGRLTDYSHTETPLMRLGHSVVVSPQSSGVTGTTGELAFLRLSDGTPLSQNGALAAGAMASQFDVYLYSLDAAVRYRGFSLNAEAYMRWIEDIQGSAPLPVSQLFQSGFYVEGGYFLIKKKLDLNLRYSQVSGSAGDASEVAVGLNWFPLKSHRMKISFDVTRLDGSPLQNASSDILAGDDGLLFRTQYQAEF